MDPGVELLTVDDSFHIQGRWLVVLPDFSVPNGWKDQVETVVVEKPGGQKSELVARFNLTHFNLSFPLTDPRGSIDRRWRVIVMLPKVTKADLPIGSKIFVSRELRDKLHSARPIDSPAE
jgi:hypothetical protein